MIFRAGLALNTVGSFVNGLMPLRAFVAGFLMTTNLANPGTRKAPVFEFFVPYFSERLDDAFDVLSRHIVLMLLSDFLNEFRLRHQLGHVSSVLPNHPVTTLA